MHLKWILGACQGAGNLTPFLSKPGINTANETNFPWIQATYQNKTFINIAIILMLGIPVTK